jgi:hypothetical protein
VAPPGERRLRILRDASGDLPLLPLHTGVVPRVLDRRGEGIAAGALDLASLLSSLEPAGEPEDLERERPDREQREGGQEEGDEDAAHDEVAHDGQPARCGREGTAAGSRKR